MDIIPEYTIGHHRVAKMLIRNLSVPEIDWLVQELDEKFRQGMWKEQQRYSLKWMKDALARESCTHEAAAALLNTDRTTVGRWISGMANPPFQQVQRFYVIFGGEDVNDHPFKEKSILNLGGYVTILDFVREWLQERGLVNQCEKPFELPNSLIFVILYIFYSNIDAKEHLKLDSSLTDYLINLISRTAKYCAIDAKSIDEIKILDVIEYWGTTWLFCLTLLAQEDLGVSEFKVSVNRPVRLLR